MLMETNIDITLRNRKARIRNWVVRDEGNSDHRLITFDVGGEEATTFKQWREEEGRLLVRKADWNMFDTKLRGFMSVEREYESVDDEVLDLTTSVLIAAETAMPRNRGVQKQTKWWTADLTVLRSHVKRARRRLQRAGDSPERDARLRDYRRARNSYFVAVKKAKREAWEKFVTEEGNKDPWGIPYKVLADKQKKELLLSSMKFEDEYEHDVDQLAKKLLHVLLPDDLREDTESHAAIRREAEEITATEGSEEITEEELWKALSSMGKKKAPGYVEITVEIWIKAWPVVRHKVLDLVNRCLASGKFPSAWKIGIVKILYKGCLLYTS